MRIKRLLADSYWISIKQVVSICTSIIISSIMARSLSMEIFGKYQLVLSILAILSISSLSGLNVSITTAIAKGYDGDYIIARRIKYVSSFIGTIGLIITGIFFLINSKYDIGISCLIISSIFPIIYSTNVWESMLIAKEKFKELSLYSIAQILLNTVLIISSIYFFKNNIIVLSLAYVVSIAIPNYIIYNKTKKYIKNLIKYKKTLSYGIFMTIMSMINVIVENIDKLIIGYFIGIEQLAIYTIGILIFNKIKNMIKNFLSILSSRIARNNTMKWKYYIPIFFISCIGTCILYFIIPYIIELLYTSKYSLSIPVAQLTIIFIPFFIIKILAKNHFIFNVRDKKVLYNLSLYTPLIKFILMIPALYYYGIYGLAFLLGFQHIIELVIIYKVRKK